VKFGQGEPDAILQLVGGLVREREPEDLAW
jgi:hypothetical protein